MTLSAVGSHRRSIAFPYLPEFVFRQVEEVPLIVDIQSAVGVVLGVNLSGEEQDSPSVGGIGDEAVVAQKVEMILDDLDFGWSAWFVLCLLFHCSDDL